MFHSLRADPDPATLIDELKDDPEYGLIDDTYCTLILENLALLKTDFLAAVGSDVWKMKFVESRLASPVDLLRLPDRFFERINRLDTLNAMQEIREILPETIPVPVAVGKNTKNAAL